MSPKRIQIYITSFYLATKTLLSVLIPSLYFLCGGKNWRLGYCFPVVAAPVCIAILFIPESPRYYYDTKQYDKLRELVLKFAKYNSIYMNPDFDIDKEVKEQNAVGETTQHFSKFNYLKQRVILTNLVII